MPSIHTGWHLYIRDDISVPGLGGRLHTTVYYSIPQCHLYIRDDIYTYGMTFLYPAWEADYTQLSTIAYHSAIYTYGMTFLYLASGRQTPHHCLLQGVPKQCNPPLYPLFLHNSLSYIKITWNGWIDEYLRDNLLQFQANPIIHDQRNMSTTPSPWQSCEAKFDPSIISLQHRVQGRIQAWLWLVP